MAAELDIVSALRRSELALCEQVSSWEALAFGVAHCAPAFPGDAGLNQLRDVWLADVDANVAFNRCEAYYAERGLTCLAWSPAADQPVAPVADLLSPLGWRKKLLTAMALDESHLTEASAGATAEPAIRILPARAMRRALAETFDEATPESDDADAKGAEAALAEERLNDASYDFFVATLDGRPAGRVGYLTVGDFARLTEVYVVPALRGRGVARTMISHVMLLARRLLPRAVVASADADDPTAVRFLEHFGFQSKGVLTQFLRPN